MRQRLGLAQQRPGEVRVLRRHLAAEELERRRGFDLAVRVAPEDGGATFRADDRVVGVLELEPEVLVHGRIGREEGKRADILFIEADMKKEDGFKKSVKISKMLGIYRQDYCGCRHSTKRKESPDVLR